MSERQITTHRSSSADNDRCWRREADFRKQLKNPGWARTQTSPRIDDHHFKIALNFDIFV
jgi:hypothetical protein